MKRISLLIAITALILLGIQTVGILKTINTQYKAGVYTARHTDVIETY